MLTGVHGRRPSSPQLRHSARRTLNNTSNARESWEVHGRRPQDSRQNSTELYGEKSYKNNQAKNYKAIWKENLMKTQKRVHRINNSATTQGADPGFKQVHVVKRLKAEHL